MKKFIKLKYVGFAVFIFFFIVLLTFHFGNLSIIKERLSNAYLNSSSTCSYLKTTSENDSPAPSDFDCVLGKSGAHLKYEAQIQAFVLDRVARDFPNHNFGLSWSPEDDIDPTTEAYPMLWPEGVAGVWICSDPAIHPLTTTTYALALCSMKERWVGDGVEGAVKIYEIRPSFFGMVGRRIYERKVPPQAGSSTAVALRVSFDFFNAHVVALEEEHYLNVNAKVKVRSRVMVYRDAAFEPFFEFNSFAFVGPPRDCETLPHVGCEAKARAFQFLRNPLINGDSVSVFEGSAPEIFEDWDNAKAIPFIFNSKNWTLKRAFPRKPGESF